MRRRPPISTRTDTLFPYTTLFRSLQSELRSQLAAGQEKDAQIQALQERNALLEKNQKAQATRIADMAARTEKTFLELRSEEHTSELQSLMRISYAVFCLIKKKSAENIESDISSVSVAHEILK